VGRPRSIVDIALAVRLVGRGHTDRAAARKLGVSPWTVGRFRRLLPFGLRRGGRPRKDDPDIAPARGRASLVPVRDADGRVIGHRLGAVAA
jgi:hypothetical protein